MRMIYFRTALCVSFVLLMAGCALNETASVMLHGNRLTQVIESNSGALSVDIKIREILTTHEGDLLKTQVSIINNSDDIVGFRYKFKWFDEKGLEVAIDRSPWTPMTISPFETKAIHGVAPKPSVNAFKILIQD